MSKLYLTNEIFLMKLDNSILFVSDVEDFSEPVHPDASITLVEDLVSQ